MPAALESNWYLPVATGSALVGMLLERIFHRLRHLITVLDALTIGLFGAIGTTKALALGLPEVPAIFVGVISAVGGSILRDLLLNVPIALMSVGSLYAVAALVGTTSLVVLVALGADITLAAIACVALTFAGARPRRALQVDAARAGRAAAPTPGSRRSRQARASSPDTVDANVHAALDRRPALGRSTRCGSRG